MQLLSPLSSSDSSYVLLYGPQHAQFAPEQAHITHPPSLSITVADRLKCTRLLSANSPPTSSPDISGPSLKQLSSNVSCHPFHQHQGQNPGILGHPPHLTLIATSVNLSKLCPCPCPRTHVHRLIDVASFCE
ncbi:hypothetical protein K504DRAFT_49258 [Pleomassaria siparia CBS 279.74]|uniref:Uncharacterized protein n=1 Tax=Pleomassaria siparia CBS 279.74 TaxID=1314801 RepID=A0A6G1K3F5_9PLEO|nr:hypothetical protein K504DRAFT_49258 [Pleomassaria siparia CBS 279.74]